MQEIQISSRCCSCRRPPVQYRATPRVAVKQVPVAAAATAEVAQVAATAAAEQEAETETAEAVSSAEEAEVATVTVAAAKEAAAKEAVEAPSLRRFPSDTWTPKTSRYRKVRGSKP
mmetsp:Transcript_7462/g.27233  ORF Transcript_7462/g.27233 Transcript_7462/m.27233 type:complete len:116 (+) Transcript_7462:5725-6072(+)